ncbi:hypothetical protein BDV59DRAFT_166696 [Aspergillus ambiguus]|uniref:DUF4246 domain-containing protein n=1 Tax=Aspergillus ambiguus TaxID=176160 RepID=UPI003CCDC792
MESKTNPIKLPGFNLPLNYRPNLSAGMGRDMFFNALDYEQIDNGHIGRTRTAREILMMRVINTITDKPSWDKKVFDEMIVTKWRDELLASGQDITPKMLDWIIKELQWKAGEFQQTGVLDIFDVGVIKSDSAVSEELKQALQKAVAPLENVEEKDYHPRSDMKVIDLVHPSLFPLVYGRTWILPDRTIGLSDCLQSIGQGKVLEVPPEEEAAPSRRGRSWLRGINQSDKIKPYSRKFQWLPCDVKFTDDGCKISSYINNLHPLKHKSLYDAIEKILSQTIPLWDRALTCSWNGIRERIPYHEVEYLEHPDPEPIPAEGEEDDDDFYERRDAWEGSRPIKKPEPGEFEPPVLGYRGEQIILRERFNEDGLQVIVKLANIELTPENPQYEGGSWHIEGQLNERICATAIYYYDSENITETTLSFRQRVDEEKLSHVSYEQDRHEFVNVVYGFQESAIDNDHITQELGSVICREGRLLTFPNILQHRVSPFELADRSKPGHRKILAFFLIDPHLRIISSANIPPQQEDWAQEQQELITRVLRRKLPAELQGMVRDNIPNVSMTFDEAKDYRLELMEERSARSEMDNEQFEVGSINLCEH